MASNQPIAKSPHLRRNFEFAKQVAFTMKKKGIKANLKRVEECTERIDAWIKKAERNQGDDAVHHTKLDFIDLNAVQANASRLHRTISRSWCKAKPQHSTFLLLEQRLQRPRKKRKGQHSLTTACISGASCFKLSIRGDCFLHHPQFNTEVRIVESTPR